VDRRFYKLIIISFILSLFLSNSYGQDNQKHIYFQVNTGVNSFELHELKNTYLQIVNTYINNGINISNSILFPPNLFWGADFIYPVNKYFSLGGGFKYSKTRASSLYGDYSGTLDITSTVDFLSWYTLARIGIEISESFSIAGESAFGISMIDLNITEDLIYTDFSNYFVELNGDGSSLNLCFSFIVFYRLYTYQISLSSGYRFSKINTLDASISGTSGSGSGELEMEIDISGLIFQLGFSIPITTIQ